MITSKKSMKIAYIKYVMKGINKKFFRSNLIKWNSEIMFTLKMMSYFRL